MIKISLNQKVAYYDGVSYENKPDDLVIVSQEGFDAAMRRATGETLDIVDIHEIDGELHGRVIVVPAPTPSEEELRAACVAALKAQAKAALEASDVTVMRCAEARVLVPEAWRDYRQALRAIIASESGDADAGLPTRPPFPEGT